MNNPLKGAGRGVVPGSLKPAFVTKAVAVPSAIQHNVPQPAMGRMPGAAPRLVTNATQDVVHAKAPSMGARFLTNAHHDVPSVLAVKPIRTVGSTHMGRKKA